MKHSPTLLRQVLCAFLVFCFGIASLPVAAQVLTQAPIQAPTQSPIQAPMQAPTQAPAPAQSSSLNATAVSNIAIPAVDTLAENPYGLVALWAQGDWVAKITLLVLLIMSLSSWYVLISKLLAQSRMKKQTRAAEKALVNAKNLREGLHAVRKDSPYYVMLSGVLEDVRMHSAVAGQVDLNTWAAQSIERTVGAVQSQSQNGLAVLATVGSTSPFVGLFGTVWGIYNALVKIGASGQASIDKVAGPVGEALIMTALGLAVAIPAVLGYNWLVRRNKTNMDGVRNFGSNLHTTLLRLAEKTKSNKANSAYTAGSGKANEVAVHKVTNTAVGKPSETAIDHGNEAAMDKPNEAAADNDSVNDNDNDNDKGIEKPGEPVTAKDSMTQSA